MSGISRRMVLIGAAVVPVAVPVAACRTEQKTRAAKLPATGQVLAATADIPVGSGKVVGDVVLTQPQAGVFDGFIARCTHAGCVLTSVDGNTIVCPCHGSKFDLDGAVARGPATQPLVKAPISVNGGSIVAG